MAYYTPLRYPGGKGKLSGYFESLISANGLEGGTYIEPFAGGAGIATTLLIRNKVSNIVINDADRSIYAFWECIRAHGDELISSVNNAKLDMNEWRRQREIQREKGTADIFDLGFSTLYMNRTNRSGIITGGVIGGQNQAGPYKMDARFNKLEIVRRIRALADRSEDISVSCLDATDFLKDGLTGHDVSKTLVYIDPPYYVKGSCLYMNYYTPDDHSKLADVIVNMKHKWVLSYDDVPQIATIYENRPVQRFKLNYSSYSRRMGDEVFYFCDGLKSEGCMCESRAVSGLGFEEFVIID
ncbi:MAG: DNA adenine methylase [Gammaproteobacteria bacterium]|jgi:DNA adenine methylase|nr:DNA adenine methylase [Gammaproteobacteria bacterium]